MGIIGNILGKREPVVEYRTVDGGHPAPYPDMTDEQLYNYEVAFNVPRRTFDKPPRPARPAGEKPEARSETKTHPRSTHQEKTFDTARHASRTAKEPPVAHESATQEHGIPGHAARPDHPPPIDFSRPVRTVTTKQPVEIITTRARHPIYKVHGYIGDDNIVTVFTLNGQISENGPRFLENVPQQLHLNIYLNPAPREGERYLVTQHETKESADLAAKPGRVACVAVQF